MLQFYGELAGGARLRAVLEKDVGAGPREAEEGAVEALKLEPTPRAAHACRGWWRFLLSRDLLWWKIGAPVRY